MGYICFVGKIEHALYVSNSLSEIADKTAQLYESMMDREDDEVVRLCDDILEILNTIKEYHTNETLL